MPVCRVARQRSAPGTPAGLSRTTSSAPAAPGQKHHAQRTSTARAPGSTPAASPSGAAAAAGPSSAAAPADAARPEPPSGDYLRQAREERELAHKAAEVDARLRAVRLAEHEPGPLAPEVLQQLLQECLRRQAVVEAAMVSAGILLLLMPA